MPEAQSKDRTMGTGDSQTMTVIHIGDLAVAICSVEGRMVMLSRCEKFPKLTSRTE